MYSINNNKDNPFSAVNNNEVLVISTFIIKSFQSIKESFVVEKSTKAAILLSSTTTMLIFQNLTVSND